MDVAHAKLSRVLGGMWDVAPRTEAYDTGMNLTRGTFLSTLKRLLWLLRVAGWASFPSMLPTPRLFGGLICQR